MASLPKHRAECEPLIHAVAKPLGNGSSTDVRLIEDMASLASDADDALDRSVQTSMFDRLEWLRLTQSYVLPEARLVVGRARQDGQAAWVFLQDRGGRTASAFASWYTLAFAPVFTPGTDQEARKVLLSVTAQALRARFDRITLEPLPPRESALLADAFRNAGWWALENEASANWVASTANLDFDTYWAARPSRLRNTVRRKARAADLQFEVLDHFDPEAWEAYEAIYRASWKPAEGSPQFLLALASLAGSAGTLRLGLARRNGTPVAAQLWTVEHGRAIIHKLAHLDAERPYSPGTLLTRAMFQYVIDHDRPEVIDFGTGDDRYKADWMDERRALQRLTLFNKRSLGGIARATRAAGAAFARGRRS